MTSNVDTGLKAYSTTHDQDFLRLSQASCTYAIYLGLKIETDGLLPVALLSQIKPRILKLDLRFFLPYPIEKTCDLSK